MRHERNVWVVGGDMRQAKLAELLFDDGHTVHTWALEGTEKGPVPGARPRGGGPRRLRDPPPPGCGEGGRLNASALLRSGRP